MDANKRSGVNRTEESISIEINEKNKNEIKGVEFTIETVNDLLNKVPRGIAAALRLAAICYNSPEIKRLASLDKCGCNFMHDLSEAAYALASIDGNIRDRIFYSIRKTPEIYNILDIGENLKDISD
jgi:hypothetical protein|nr:MAG TPA: hypothetical protein [Caudoviricetes sp.]